MPVNGAIKDEIEKSNFLLGCNFEIHHHTAAWRVK